MAKNAIPGAKLPLFSLLEALVRQNDGGLYRGRLKYGVATRVFTSPRAIRLPPNVSCPARYKFWNKGNLIGLKCFSNDNVPQTANFARLGAHWPRHPKYALNSQFTRPVIFYATLSHHVPHAKACLINKPEK